MNKRTVGIIQRLYEADGDISLSSLAEDFQVSLRTIRNDLNAISDLLKENHLEPLTLEKGGKVVCAEDFPEILSSITSDDYYSYKLSREERVEIAAKMLIQTSGYLTLSDIAEHLVVSRATVINDLDEIKSFLRKGSLKVLSHSNKGLRIEGRESDKRIFLLRLELAARQRKNTASEQEDENEAILRKLLIEQEHVHKSFLTDDSFWKILVYLEIMIARNRQGEYAEIRKKNPNSKQKMAADILKYTGQYCHLTTTGDEVQLLSELLVMAYYMKQESKDANAVKIQLSARKFIERISEDLSVNLNHDFTFFDNLSAHLEAMSERDRVEEENPVIQELLKENQSICLAVKKELPILEQSMERAMGEAEAGYVAVHVCAAMERKKNREISFHVILACHAGIGTSRLLKERLRKHFNFQIVDVVSAHEAAELSEGQADFIISTVPLKNCKIQWVQVSPLLPDSDYIRVGNMVDTLRDKRDIPSGKEYSEEYSGAGYSGKKSPGTLSGLMEKIAPIVYEMVPEEAAELLKKIRTAAGEYLNQPLESESEDDVYIPSLFQLLPPSHIQLDVEAADWRDAIRKSAMPLLKAGYIEERYMEAMIRNVEENGPYFVIAEGFAVPHEATDQGCLKTGMNLIRLKTPVELDDEEKIPVEFLCCLSAEDHKLHLRAFFNLVNLLKNKTFRETLRQAESPEKMWEIIRKYETELEM